MHEINKFYSVKMTMYGGYDHEASYQQRHYLVVDINTHKEILLDVSACEYYIDIICFIMQCMYCSNRYFTETNC